VEDFKAYTDKIRVRSGKVAVWFVLRVLCDGNPDNILSTVDSNSNWWYRDNHSACYLYDVQDSDDAVEVGTLACSGVHCNHIRLAKETEPIF
jgi:hypothetical protein